MSTPVTAQSTVAAADGAAPVMVTVNATLPTSSFTWSPAATESTSVTPDSAMLNTGAAVTVTSTPAAVVTLP